MKRTILLRAHMAWTVVIAVMILIVAAHFISRAVLLQVMNTVTLPISIAIIIIYAPAWLLTLRKRGWSLDGAEALSLGVGCCWLAAAGMRLYSLIWNAFDAPAWLNDGYILPALLWLNVIGGTLHITAPGAIRGELPTRNLIYLGCAVGSAVLLGLVLMWVGFFEFKVAPGSKW